MKEIFIVTSVGGKGMGRGRGRRGDIGRCSLSKGEEGWRLLLEIADELMWEDWHEGV